MATKLTKDVIKDIVKECLIEILAEGLSSNKKSTRSNSKKTRTLKEAMSSSNISSGKRSKMPKYLDDIDNSNKNDSSLRKNKRLDELASNITDDPILAEMLADTAQTTLQDQLAADSKKGFVPAGVGDTAQRMVENNDPSKLFGEEASSKWASLAFG